MFRDRIPAAFLLTLIPLAGSPGMRPLHAEPAKTILIRPARVFDGEQVLERTDVLVRGGVIEEVEKGLPAPEGAEVVDAPEHTLLPGLMDCHVHILEASMLEDALAFGVTTELDMFTAVSLAAELRKEDRKGRADFRTAGTVVTAPGGHGTEYGLEIPTLSSPQEAEEFVEARIREGSDYVKVIYDDGKASGLSFPTLSRETLRAVIAAAKKRARLVVVHVEDQTRAKEAVEEGADGLAHIFYDRPPELGFAALVKAKGAFVIPTLAVLESACGKGGGEALAADERVRPYLSSPVLRNLEASFPSRPGAPALSLDPALQAVRELVQAGVPILAGTDSPNPGTAHGVSLHRELELLVQAGLQPKEALAAATSVPARAFGLSDRGRIAPRLRADLVLVKGDPTRDIRSSRALTRIWRGGRSFDRERYRAELEERRRAGAVLQGPGIALVSDFEGKISSRFGAGWQISTDVIMGGKSSAGLDLVEGGAEKSSGSLRIAGTIEGGLPFARAGGIFHPGDRPFAPVDLSSKKAISFWARGDGQEARVLVFATALGREPASQTFVPGKEWKHFRFALQSFQGIDGKGFMGLLFAGGPKPGPFAFQIDQVRFE